MAIVLMPLLPTGPYGPLGGFRPREIVVFVLFFSGISFAGYIARLFVGARHGYLVAGLLGGHRLIDQRDAVVLLVPAGGRRSRSAGLSRTGCWPPATTAVRAGGRGDGRAPLPIVGTARAVAGRAVSHRHGRRADRAAPAAAGAAGGADDAESSAVRAALQMAVLFQVVLFMVEAVRTTWGDVGLVVSGAILGLADVDALMISMAHTAATGGAVAAPGDGHRGRILSNTVFKLALVTSLSRQPFSARGLGLAAMAAASLAALLVFRPGLDFAAERH